MWTFPASVTQSGAALPQEDGQPVSGEIVRIGGEAYYCIHRYDQMPPFFMSIVSSADHWLFISSTGGLTAGRVNAESALFPYYTDDKVAENWVNTGPVTCLFVRRAGMANAIRWEPFSADQGETQRIERNLYKSVTGDKLIFEEVNLDLGLTFRYAWRTSDRFGFVRTAWLQNNLEQPCTVQVLDGVRNLLPYGATTSLQTNMSNLLDAYKRSELDPATGLGLFALSATLTDRAEPSESLRATTVWQIGLAPAAHLLSTSQLTAFRRGQPITQELDIKGERGAYLVTATLELAGQTTQSWSLLADVNQDHSQIAALRRLLAGDRSALAQQVEVDITQGSTDLVNLVAAADGLQTTAQPLTTAHHFANVLFNIMRGGIFANNDRVQRADLLDFVRVRNRRVLEAQAAFFADLPDSLSITDLYAQAAATASPDLIRLCYEYLPLTFSRRHGDPSRPWNRFSINLKQPDGSLRFDYQGNWRDIFQNWEPLAWSYPMFVEGMIAKFLNATTADGYNPYRVTRDGIEWEAPEPHNPWSNIGYWSDHQIIYLQKLLEVAEHFHPGALSWLLDRRIFSHADVPYRIRTYAALLADSYNTIDFDWAHEEAVAARVRELGTDGKLVTTAGGEVFHVSLAEKLITLLLAKLGNLVPEGGIWMNTQRPEWNDANNALVGRGISVVTAAYLRRYIVFCQGLFAGDGAPLSLTRELAVLLDGVQAILDSHLPALATGFDDGSRRALLDEMGATASAYRHAFYQQGFTGDLVIVDRRAILHLLEVALAYIDQTLRANRRADSLYHAYNILQLGDGIAAVEHLYEMLEGQVAILSSGLLAADESLALLTSLRRSHLYRADQHSYILYPDRELPGFLAKNCIPAAQVEGLALVDELTRRTDLTLLVRDADGVYHFNGAFRNAGDVIAALERLRGDPTLATLVERDGAALLQVFEATFHHRAFTGRSGTFFAFEGLGSIYWHMVSKLLLAAQEAFWQAVAAGADAATLNGLATAYDDIRAGIGFNKSPATYGAFPTDPYSHTPKGKGAKQPGMTGQVKEEILTRFGELGVRVQAGAIEFHPLLLDQSEFSQQPAAFDYVAMDGQRRSLDLPANGLAFTLGQTPVVLVRRVKPQVEVIYADGQRKQIPGAVLEPAIAAHIFRRDGVIDHLVVTIAADQP
jgi:hypothetical protein